MTRHLLQRIAGALRSVPIRSCQPACGHIHSFTTLAVTEPSTENQLSRLRRVFIESIRAGANSIQQNDQVEHAHSAITQLLNTETKDFELAEHLFKDLLLSMPSFDPNGEIFTFFVIQFVSSLGAAETIDCLVRIITSCGQNALSRLTPFAMELVLTRGIDIKALNLHEFVKITQGCLISLEPYITDIISNVYLPHRQYDKIPLLVEGDLQKLTVECIEAIFSSILEPEKAITIVDRHNCNIHGAQYGVLEEVLSMWGSSFKLNWSSGNLRKAMEICILQRYYPSTERFLKFIAKKIPSIKAEIGVPRVL